ncbi:hypothetical protein VTN31DRAFT_2857 [Thermomyces dupontii]|uniref:uncharacterized protein n=1 Tax=Talaromyces thermophilus TaxID=28565 RepID=UPI003743168C
MSSASPSVNVSCRRSIRLSRRLLHQCRLLLAELDAFYNTLRKRLRRHQQQQHLVEMRLLRSNVISELRSLERLSSEAEALAASQAATDNNNYNHTVTNPATDDDDGGEKDYEARNEMEEEEEVGDEAERRILHALRSSNLPFYVAVWTIAKERCHGVVAFSKRFYWEAAPQRGHVPDAGDGRDPNSSKQSTVSSSKDTRKSVSVDIVCDGGEEWVKVSTITETRLLFEMAEKGWERDEEGDTDGEIGKGSVDMRAGRPILPNSDSNSLDDDDEIGLIKLAADMTKAARATRVRYRHPRIRIVLPKVVQGKYAEIDSILNEMRRFGVTVECGIPIPDVFNDEFDGNRDPASVAADDLPLETLLPRPSSKFTESLNVDCTLLLALVSDLSHNSNLTPSPSHHRAIIRQIEIEEEQPLVPTELWPAVENHPLVCTKEAIKRMKEIVHIIGTETEKKRTAIIFGDPPFDAMDRKELLRQFQQLTDYQVPETWMLPIKVVDAKAEIDQALQRNALPDIAHKLEEVLTDINRSVFFYGWVKDITTITSNRTVAKQIETMIEENRNGDDHLRGPPVWVCETARSLIGKEKNRKP